jgi:hypothetical protein
MKCEVLTAVKHILWSYGSWHRVVWDIASNASEETSAFNLYPERAASGALRKMEAAGLFETSVSTYKIHDTTV